MLLLSAHDAHEPPGSACTLPTRKAVAQRPWARLASSLPHFAHIPLAGIFMAPASKERGAGLSGVWHSCMRERERRTWVLELRVSTMAF